MNYEHGFLNYTITFNYCLEQSTSFVNYLVSVELVKSFHNVNFFLGILENASAQYIW